MLAVPLVFYFQCSRAAGWEAWIDSELANREFCDHLEQAGVLRSILISRSSNIFRDTEALRQLVRRWCPSTHIFLCSQWVDSDIRGHGEPLAVTNIGWSRPSRSGAFPWGIEDRSCSSRLHREKEHFPRDPSCEVFSLDGSFQERGGCFNTKSSLCSILAQQVCLWWASRPLN